LYVLSNANERTKENVMLKKTLLAAAAGLMTVGSAAAADLPRRGVAPVIVVPMFTWTGFYVGGHAGYGFSGDDKVTTGGQLPINATNVLGGARPGSVSLDRDGFIGGAQIGYNMQFGQFVAGVEADISYTDFRDRRNFITTPLSGISTLNNSFQTELQYLGTVRGRLGVAFDRLLVYGTGGFAFGQIENSAAFSGPAPASVLQFTGKNDKTRGGYAVGGGLEYAFTNNLTVKGEYLYYDLGSNTVNVAVIPGSGGGGSGYNSRFKTDGHIVRVGLNYKFGG